MTDSPYLIPDWPVRNAVNALFSLRAGGVSQAPYTSFNVGAHVGDAPMAVAENRMRLTQHLVTTSALSTPTQMSRSITPVWLWQKHTPKVVILDRHSLYCPQDSIEADACISNTIGLACAVQVADCLPVLFTNAEGSWVGAAHAGWRGLQAGVLENTVTSMREQIRSQSKAGHADEVLYTWLGPCIGSTCFEVGEEVLQAFVGGYDTHVSAYTSSTQQGMRVGFVASNSAGKYLCDLVGLARLRLQRLGVTQIYGNNGQRDWCTYSNPTSFFSHRRDGARLGSSGRMVACIGRKVPSD